MDDEFKDLLTQEQIEQCTIKVLEEECILTVETFNLLKMQHLDELLPKIRIGQHAKLLQIWESSKAVCTSASPTYIAGSFSMISSKFTVTVYMLQQIQVKAVHHAANPLVQIQKTMLARQRHYVFK